MKKEKLKGFASGVLVSILSFALIGGAMAAYQKTATLDYTGIKITMDGKAITPTDANGNVVEPFAIDGTTYLPVRGIASALGLSVSWDGATQTVALSSGATPAAATGGTYSRSNPAPIGTAQTVSVENIMEKYNATITVTEAFRGAEAWDKIKSANKFNDAPADGKEYVLYKVKATINSSDEDKSVHLTDYNFKVFSSTNAEYSIPSVVTPDPEFSGDAYVGGTIEGYAAILADKSDPAPKIVYGAEYDGTGGVWFAVTK